MKRTAKDRLWRFVEEHEVDVANIDLSEIIERHSGQVPRSAYPASAPLPDDVNTCFWQTDWEAVLREVTASVSEPRR